LGPLLGSEVKSTNLQPILYKRLRIQGSTLRSRTAEYQADLIARLVEYSLLPFAFLKLAGYFEDLTVKCYQNSQEKMVMALSGYIFTRFKPDYSFLPLISLTIRGDQVYPWTEIQDAHREMAADANRFVEKSITSCSADYLNDSGKIIAEVA
jgi:hypothetical protein